MLNFEFVNPTKILFGRGEVEKLNQEIPAGSKVLILYGGGSIKKNGVLADVKAALAGYETGEFGGIEPNPSYDTLMQAVELVRRENYDFLLAVGGGSVIDGTKFVSVAAPFTQGDPWELITRQLRIERAIPFGTVLTLPATGSEMNHRAVITRRSLQAKLPLRNYIIFPRFSVLDPLYTYSLPVGQVANGVVDAFVHVMEQYLTYPIEAKVQDRFAEGLLQTLVEEGQRVKEDPENYQVRANIMWSATLGLNGLIGSGVPGDWATHMIGHEITALYGLDHAHTLAIVLPSLLTVRKEAKLAKLVQYGQRVWQLDKELPAEEAAQQAIDKTRAFFETMGLKTRFADYGLGKEVIDKIADNLIAHNMVKLGEGGAVTPDVARQVLEHNFTV